MTRRHTIAALVGVLASAVTAEAQTLRVLDDPTLGEFTDISLTGENLRLGDDQEVELPIAFAGNFVLLPGTIVVGMNGGIGFGTKTVTDLEPINQKIPSNDAFIGGQAAIAYWDDIDDKEGDVFFLAEPDEPIIVQWNVPNFDGAGGTLEFQVKIFGNSAPTGIYAQFLYIVKDSGGAGASATIGYQDGEAGFGDIQFSFNDAGAVTDGTVLSLARLEPCPGDIDGDVDVDFEDLLALLASWGPCPGCPEDLDGDGVVAMADLLMLLAGWGDCPGP